MTPWELAKDCWVFLMLLLLILALTIRHDIRKEQNERKIS